MALRVPLGVFDGGAPDAVCGAGAPMPSCQRECKPRKRDVDDGYGSVVDWLYWRYVLRNASDYSYRQEPG